VSLRRRQTFYADRLPFLSIVPTPNSVSYNLPKKVLIITFHYPPAPAATPSPICEWVKYLPEFGWKPFVLTASGPFSAQLNACQTNSIYRIPHHQSFKKLVRFRSRFSHNSLPFKLLNFLLINFLLYPDDKRGWLKSAFYHGQSLIKDKNIDLIISSGAPWTDFLVANRLSKKMGVPWIAHYRDPWTQSTSQRVRLKWIFQTAISRMLEKNIIGSALFCLHASDLWAIQLRQMSGKDVYWIPNGYDSNLFRNSSQFLPSRNVFTLSYVGSLHFPQKLDSFLEGFERFITTENLHSDSCKLNFIGTSDLPLIRKKYHSLIPFIGIRPYMEKQAAIKHMLQSHILLLFSNNDDGWYPAKLYDYLASNRVIMSSPDSGGVINKILKRTNAGVVLDKPIEIANWLSTCMKRFRLRQKLESHSTYDEVKELDRRKLTEKLSRLLNTIPLLKT